MLYFKKNPFIKGGFVLEDEAIINRLKEVAKEGKISCAMAMKIADDFHVPIKRVGELLNQIKVKIAQCQLGCF